MRPCPIRSSRFRRSLARAPGDGGEGARICILTAARSGETLAARWDEIDFEAKVWTVPAERHEGGARASRSAVRSRRSPSTGNGNRADGRIRVSRPRAGRPLSGMAFESCCGAWRRRLPRTASEARSATGPVTRRISRASSPSTRWRSNRRPGRTSLPAKRRAARRRELMDAWARYCERGASDNVLTFKRPA